jgi:uncharacterized membrane protein
MLAAVRQMPKNRLLPLDALRGLIMIVMALDHANAFIAHAHPPPEFWSGSFPTYRYAIFFLTRLVTHLAAPGFFFLMGAGMALFADSRRRLGWTEGAIVQHFVVRGVILILLQLFVENPAWQIASILNGGGRVFPVYLGVLYGLGGAMILAAGLQLAPTTLLAALSLALMLYPELNIRFARGTTSLIWVGLLLVPTRNETVTVYYPVLAWLGLAGFGLLFGRWLLKDRASAYRRSALIGMTMLILFVILRDVGGFGNIRSVAADEDWIAFFNVVKYPPSLVFVLLALGVDLILLSLLARIEGLAQPLAVLGRSPLFFYIAHLYLYGLIGVAAFPNGTGILQMYPVWLAGLAILFAACWAFGRFKLSQPPESVWRFA